MSPKQKRNKDMMCPACPQMLKLNLGMIKPGDYVKCPRCGTNILLDRKDLEE